MGSVPNNRTTLLVPQNVPGLLMIDCYFCHEEYQEVNQYNHHQPCPHCSERWKNIKTYTVYDDEGILINAQIYVVRSKVIEYPTMRIPGLMTTGYMQLGWDYQFRLEFANQKTVLNATGNDNIQHIVDIPGFPVTPDNAENKLDLYLTFS